MKKAKKLMAVVLALMVALTMGIATSIVSFADETSQHTITITNTDQNVSHSYEAYQVFKGKLDADQQKLSDIVWGNGVDAAGLITALKATSDTNLAALKTAVANVDTTDSAQVSAAATTVAKEVAKFGSTSGANQSAGAVDAFAAIVATKLATKAADFTADANDSTKYTASVTGDGYYFVKDTTSTLVGTTGSDSLSKYLLAVVKDTTIEAKDTGLTPDKEIVSGNQRVKTGTAAIGDPVQFEVKIKVPNTKKYVDHFVFDMVDQLPDGLTFMQIDSVQVGTDNVPYTLASPANYEKPETNAAAANATGGQEIKIVFNEFKANAEANNWIGKDLVVKYTAVVNIAADFTPSGNLNEVKFDFSNDPNHTYTGDEPGDDEPMGVTPKDQTKTLLTNIELTKIADNNQTNVLGGAEFEITSDDYNITLVSGEKFDVDASGTYYKLKDGSYTETAPTESTASSYDSTQTKYKKVEFTDAVTTPGTTKKVTVITDSNGKISLKGLKPGTYTLKETKAPSGYNLDSTEYKIVLDFNGTNIVLKTGEGGSTSGVTFDGTTATAKITVNNESGSTLPSTGGIGTTIFYILGALLVIGCGILLIARRRLTAK